MHGVWVNLFVVFAVLCPYPGQADDVPVETLTDDRTTLTWKSTDDLKSFLLEADDGYQIQMDFLNFTVDGESGNYVTIKTASDDSDTDDALMFTYTLNGNPKYLYNSNKVQVDYVRPGEQTSDKDAFQIMFTRVGEATTTTPVPDSTTTTEQMPTASPEENDKYTVYVYGRAAADYGGDEIEALQKCIAGMGAEYCDSQGCPLEQPISYQHVKIVLLDECPLLWQNYDQCISLTFALPIVKSDAEASEIFNGYQLSTANLKHMWDNYADKYLNEAGLSPYNAPNVNRIFTTRLITISLIVIMLVLLILTVRHLAQRIDKRRRKHSDTVSIIDRQTRRPSSLQLPAHYLQEMPPFFPKHPLYAEQRTRSGGFSQIDESLEDVEELSPPGTLNIGLNDENQGEATTA